MKKFIIVAISLILILTFSIPCFAATYGNMHEYENHAVYGQYRYSSDPNVYMCTLTNGKYIIETASGLIVTVVPKNPDSQLRLVVRIIPKTDEAYSWFEKCFQSFDGNIIPLDIYYVDADGNRINIYDDILIEINSNDKVNKVFTLSTDGVVDSIDSTITSTAVSFEANGKGYYVLFFENQKNNNTVPEKPNNDVPKTNDLNIVCISTFLMIFSAIFASVSLLVYRKKKREEQNV